MAQSSGATMESTTSAAAPTDSSSALSAADPVDLSYLVLLGAGPSSSVPLLYCLAPDVPCAVCKSALSQMHTGGPNYRSNPALLIKYDVDGLGTYRHVLIDCGKTFHQQALRFFPLHHVKYLDAVVLTHEHADAILGLDDLRSLQGREPVPIPIFADAKTLASCRRIFPYLTGDTPVVAGVVRHVASLNWQLIEHEVGFTAGDLAIRPLPVMHGEDYVALGFEFGRAERVVYLSDVSRVPETTMSILREGPQIALLYVDSLFIGRTHATHFVYHESLAFIREIKPRRAVLIGLTHDFDYEPVTAELSELFARGELPCPVVLGRDGLVDKVSLR
eukprot:c5776_g1_i2.p1 GENE.c5776_g1_i2~~c5776_g1_i2.p1  ORF type:complete len:343 (-),score=40.99 c5776_g1_i2:889-1887(-)